MPRTIRYHLDETCNPAIAGGLRRRGVGVTTTPEAGLLRATDEAQAAYALAEGRVLFTQDRDFLRLHASGTPHLGIVYCDKDTLSIGEILSGLVLVWEVYDPEEMVGRIEYL
jgi:predicted nuclease of predicted toxin-antitoxin system